MEETNVLKQTPAGATDGASFPIDPSDVRWLETVVRRLADPDDAQDVAQEAWLAAASARPAAGNGMRPWLRTVARNHERMLRRRRWRREPMTSEPSTEQPTFEQDLHHQRVCELLPELLATLSSSDRRILELRFARDCTSVEIARRLDMQPAAVRARISRALERLRRGLDRRFGGRQAWAFALLPIPSRTSSTAAKGASTMSVYAKVTVAATALAASVLAWFVGGDASEQHSGQAAPLAEVAVPDPTPEPPAEDVRRQRWAKLRAAILASQEARRHPTPSAEDERITPPPTLPVPSYSEKQALLSRLFSESSETILSCITERAGDTARGSVVFDVHIVGEPDIGVVVDDVQMVDDTAQDPALAACLIEGAPAFAFDPVPYPVEQSFRFTADLETQSLGFLTELEIDDIDAFLADQGRHLGEDERREIRAHLQENPRVPQGLSISERRFGPEGAHATAEDLDRQRQELEGRLSELIEAYGLPEPGS